MDELEEYRDRIEQRYKSRRTKTDRRSRLKEQSEVDWNLVADAAMFVALLTALYFWR